MKKLTYSFLASAALATSAFAGHEAVVSKEYKAPAPEPCFRDTEFQLDIFGSYSGTYNNGDIGDGFGAAWRELLLPPQLGHCPLGQCL
jgi:hypothetical protein